MPSIEIKSLCTRNRFPNDGVKICCLLLYLPVGLALLVLRLFLGLIVILLSYVLPDVPAARNIITKLANISLGISIYVENPKEKEDCKVFVSNQVSVLDHFIVHTATECVTPTTEWEVNPLLTSVLGLYDYGPVSTFDDVKKNIATFISTKSVPIHFQPEACCTNGSGLLKFKTWPFSFSPQVQAVSLRVSRPFLDISVTTVESVYWKDLFFYLFSPCTNYRLKYLPLMEKKDLDSAAFAESVRQQLASVMKIEATSYSAADILEWRKRYRLDRMQRHPGTQSPVNVHPEVTIMANQVKEVLPLVPYNVIVRDLVKTRSVNATISNILEGHVAYTPEVHPVVPPLSTLAHSSNLKSGVSSTSSSSSTSPSSLSSSPNKQGAAEEVSLCTAASSFPKSANERMQSFQERKAKLIQAARKKYIEKHGLNIVALNNC